MFWPIEVIKFWTTNRKFYFLGSYQSTLILYKQINSQRLGPSLHVFIMLNVSAAFISFCLSKRNDVWMAER